MDHTASEYDLSAWCTINIKPSASSRLAALQTLDVRTQGSVAACGFGRYMSADRRYYLTTGATR
ncbi:hypothetical protein [Paraburkholderia ribeironis]|uniref:hypothetical protein n=1 Tax=Paraburkholderia ribeironis TaxID=1247936 RepID=UPI000B9D5312|nr:hypothetical protein [Paraburkholderia ribeironis]